MKTSMLIQSQIGKAVDCNPNGPMNRAASKSKFLSATARTNIAAGVLLIVLALAGSGVVEAAPALRCRVDQQMWINGGGDGFGNAIVLGQTFTPLVPAPVCRIELSISKNNPAAGDLQVTLMSSNFVPLPGGSVTIPAAQIPMGISVQTIDFCCNAMPMLAGSPFFGLTLAAPTSQIADYTWINSDDAGADGAYVRGRGYGNFNGAAPGTRWFAVGYDYAFKIYTCGP
jgi:hypothetical protein